MKIAIDRIKVVVGMGEGRSDVAKKEWKARAGLPEQEQEKGRRNVQTHQQR
jgi:hypothetical protein